MTVKDYKDLLVWQKGIEVCDQVYEWTQRFPKDELYGLTSQMRKASVSISSNIAEGFVRRNSKEYRQFLYVALGSCAELDTQTIIAKRRTYLSEEQFGEVNRNLIHEMRMLLNLIKHL